MNALKIQNTLGEIERSMANFAPYRKAALFNEFLVKGYSAITLSSVSPQKFSDLLRAKLCLGTLITLYDDFADRPSQYNPELLAILYQLRFGRHEIIKNGDLRKRQVTDFAASLFSQIEDILSAQPNYDRLREILNFDLEQFYAANRYSGLLTANPFMKSSFENRVYAHHNMGMVMASMMDLSAVEEVDLAEVGLIREVFLRGQRMGRIFNVLATRQRELADGDITGELPACANDMEIRMAEKQLHKELRDLRDRIRSFESRITTFSVKAYLGGLEKVQKLHQTMEGII